MGTDFLRHFFDRRNLKLRKPAVAIQQVCLLIAISLAKPSLGVRSAIGHVKYVPYQSLWRLMSRRRGHFSLLNHFVATK